MTQDGFGQDVEGLVVAVDGPSGSGKSSAAKGVARRLGLRYLDTGAMYRALTWWMLQRSVDLDDPAAIAAQLGRTAADGPNLEIGTDPDGQSVRMDGVEVSEPIRTREVSNAVSAVAAVPLVRERMVARQRQLIGAGDIVVEGRDIGSRVAPGAPIKIYLTASAEERARRRSAELEGSAASTNGSSPGVAVTQAELTRRDHLDSSRAASPLVHADGAVELDTTGLGLDEVIDAICAQVAEAGAGPLAR